MKNVVITGNFDGVHLGHRRVVETAKKIADGLLTDLYVRSIIYHNQKKAMIKRSKRFLPTERVDRRMPAVSRPGLGTAERSL